MSEKPIQMEGEPEPRFVIHLRTTHGSGSVAVGGAVGFPKMDFFEVTDENLAHEIARRWNAFNGLIEALRDIANQAGRPTIQYSRENAYIEQRNSLDQIADGAQKALLQVSR